MAHDSSRWLTITSDVPPRGPKTASTRFQVPTEPSKGPPQEAKMAPKPQFKGQKQKQEQKRLFPLIGPPYYLGPMAAGSGG
eukprot:4419034-Pyramimonas_sp.AAC.2